MAGFDPKSIQQAMPDMLNLSKANGLGLAETSDIASNILSGFGLQTDQMGRLGDVLTATTTRANVNLSMLGETMKYVAPAARDLGISVEEAAAMSGLLGNVGIQASQGGTVLRAMLNRLSSQSGPAAEAMEQLGLKTKDADGNLRAIPEILQDVVNATNKMGNADRAGILKTIFGEEAGTGVSELIKQQGEGRIKKLVGILKNAKGENARVAKIMADNAAGDIEKLNSAWDDIRIEVFEGNNSGIRSFIQGITSAVSSIGNWIKANPELTGTLLKSAAAISAVIAVGGGLTALIASMLGPIAMLRYGLSLVGIKSFGVGNGLGMLLKKGSRFRKMIKLLIGGFRTLSLALVTTPIGWVILGITALVTAGYFLIKNWDTVKAWMSSFWESIKGYASSAWDVLKTIFGWTPLGLIANNFNGIVQFFTGLPAKFMSLGEMTMDGLIKGITGKLTQVKESITGAASSAIGWFKETLGIASPSKVFATMGDQTMQGLNVGINRSQGAPLKQVKKVGKAMAGTAMIVGATSLPAAAKPNFVSGSQLNQSGIAQASANKSGQTIHIDASINAPITIHATPGMDTQEIARQVAIQLEQHQRQQEAKLKASLRDIY